MTELKTKLQNYEVTPPENTWNRIAAILDDEVIAEFPSELYNIEITPDKDNWSAIVSVLDEPFLEYPSKLYQLEVDPPLNTWQKISTILNNGAIIRTLPKKGRLIPFIRVAAAACFLLLIGFGATKFLNGNSTDETAAIQITPAGTVPAKPAPLKPADDSTTQVVQPTNDLPKEKSFIAKTNITSARKRNPSQVLAQLHQPVPVSGSQVDFQQASLTGNIPGRNFLISEAASRYLMFMNDDGVLITISKKLADALGCLYSNGDSEEFKRCQEKVKQWREQLAKSPVSPSPANFMDILEIARSMQENEL